jgi:predicted phage gp36 major capsid-like protein
LKPGAGLRNIGGDPEEGGQPPMAARKKSSASKRFSAGLRDLEKRMPPNLRSAVRDMRGNLRVLQQQLERARLDRDARWRKIQNKMRRDLVRLLQRLEKALAPSGGKGARARASSPRRKKR